MVISEEQELPTHTTTEHCVQKELARMVHPLVDQLRFTRSEFARAFHGVSESDGVQRLMPMNSIGWIVGHLAWQEQAYFLGYGTGECIDKQIARICQWSSR
jgi:hypothetical protein